MPEGNENGIRWWLRWVIVPLCSGGGIIALLFAVITREPPLPSRETGSGGVHQSSANPNNPNSTNAANRAQTPIQTPTLTPEQSKFSRELSGPRHSFSSVPRANHKPKSF